MIKIGLFDSGIGGFSILRELLKLDFPFEPFYIADEAFSPYGRKPDALIEQRCREVTSVLVAKGVDLIVVACNTATAVGIRSLRKQYPDIPFVGVEPYLNIVNRKDLFEDQRLAVLLTPLTEHSPKFKGLKKRLDPHEQISVLGCPHLADLIERAYVEGMGPALKNEMRKELAPLQEGSFSHVILGCTHYPLIESFIEEEFGCQCISPGPYVAKRVASLLDKKSQTKSLSSSENFHFLSTLKGKWSLKKKGDIPLFGDPFSF